MNPSRNPRNLLQSRPPQLPHNREQRHQANAYGASVSGRFKSFRPHWLTCGPASCRCLSPRWKCEMCTPGAWSVNSG